MGITQLTTRRLRLLGPVGVDQIQNTQNRAPENDAEGSVAGQVPRFRSRRTQALLGFLAAEGRSFTRDYLAALFWPDWAPARARANLRRDLHNLTQILPDCWELNRQAVAFVPSDSTTVDLYRIEQFVAHERWEEAAELLGGEFLEGLYLDHNPEFENWLLGERQHWRGRAVAILTHVIEGHTQRGRYSDALHQTLHLLQLTPWNEQAQRSAMRLMAWTGQRGAALRQFEICRQLLNEEMAVEPALETIALYQQIRSGKLDLPPQLPAFLSDEEARHAYEQPLFVGRERELARLDEFLAGAVAGQSRVVFVTGGPGRGKTALLDTFGSRAMTLYPDLLVASGTCNAYSGLGDPYLPFRDVMEMLVGDVEGQWDAGAITRDHARRLWSAFPVVVQVVLDHGPHLLDVLIPVAALVSRSMAAGEDYAPWLSRLRQHAQRDRTNMEELERSRLFQQVLDVLCTLTQKQPLLLILDDIQWADAASISLLFHLGRRLAGTHSRILIACAYRPTEVGFGRDGERHPLAQPLSEFKRTFGDVWIDLGQIGEAEGRSFVDALLDAEPNRLGLEFRDILFHRTGSIPLFTIELLRAMQERGDLVKDEEGYWIKGPLLNWEAVPARVEAVIEERIDQLDPGLQEVLNIASVEGEVFTAQVVTMVGKGTDRSTLHRLSQELERQHRLVREQEEVETNLRRLSRYRFSHILFQDYLYKQLSPGERRLLHGDVAVALEKLYTGQLEDVSVQLAHHFFLAGDHVNAFHYSTVAAERAARIYESRESITHYTRAIQLADKVCPDTVPLVQLHRGRGMAYERLGEFEKALNDYTTTQKIANTANEREIEWRALIDLGKLWRSRDYQQARDYFEAALKLARRMGDPKDLADSLNWMGNWYANDENPLRAVKYHREALHIAEALGDRQELANTLDLLGSANLVGGDLVASVPYLNRAIALFRELDDRPRLASSLLNRLTTASMQVLLASQSPTLPRDPLFDYQEALQIAKEIDSASDESWAHWSMSLLHSMRGQFEHAMQVVQSGFSIASEIEHREFLVGCQFALGILYLELFAPDQMQGQLENALTLAKELHSSPWIHLITGVLAGSYLFLGDLTLAQRCLDAVISDQTPMNTLGKRYCWVRRAELALLQKNPTTTLDIAERLIASASGISSGRVITFLWKLKAEALIVVGHLKEAESLLRSAIENAHATGERLLLWRLHASLGRCQGTMGQLEAAEQEFSTARALIEELAATIPGETLQDSFQQGALTEIDAN